MNYFVTAIGTDSGKTLVSAILCKALRADYWKPIQAGLPSDSETIRGLLAGSGSKIYPEAYVFKTAASPHAAAAVENLKIEIEDINIPHQGADLIIEGAGGCLVPLNEHDFVIDLAVKFKAEIILVSNFYLGSINHTLLSYEALQLRKLLIKGIIFNGVPNSASEQIILHHTGLRTLLRIEPEKSVDQKMIGKYSKNLMENWNG